MDKLRVGGACWLKPGGKRYTVREVWEESEQVYLRNPDPAGREVFPLERVTPAPFLPGDVVEHSTFPAYGRGIVTEVIESTGKVWVSWQVAQRGMHSPDDLTLILPAQPAKEADHG